MCSASIVTLGLSFWNSLIANLTVSMRVPEFQSLAKVILALLVPADCAAAAIGLVGSAPAFGAAAGAWVGAAGADPQAARTGQTAPRASALPPARSTRRRDADDR